MGFKRFSLHVAIRAFFMTLCMISVAWTVITPGYHASGILLSIILLLLIFEFLQFINKTNAELSRFLEAARHADFSQRFQFASLGSGFEEVGQTFEDILNNLREKSAKNEHQIRQLHALVEHIPVPLISLHPDHKLTLWNSSARRLFGTQAVANLKDLSQLSAKLPDAINNLSPGVRSLFKLRIDNVEHRISLMSSELQTSLGVEKLVSLQDIQGELEFAELQAWQDLVKVLTHEIMNSLTPITSLSQTAQQVMQESLEQQNTLDNDTMQDISDAVNTVARRSKSLMQFVTSYKQLTKLPVPKNQKTDIRSIITRVCDVHSTNDIDAINIFIDVSHQGLSANFDPDLIEQVLLNLMKNAQQAVAETDNPSIRVRGFMNQRGRICIEISDNGPGIAPELLDDIFVPFFTTKKDGSGVGLALARQIMHAHKGAISVESNEKTGTTFTLTF